MPGCFQPSGISTSAEASVLLSQQVHMSGIGSVDASSEGSAAGSEHARPVRIAVNVQSRVRLPGVDISSDELSAGNVSRDHGQAKPSIDGSSDDEATGRGLSNHVKHVEKRVRLAGIDSSSDDDAADIVQPNQSGGIAGASILRRSARIRSRELHDVGRSVERGSGVRRPKRKRGSEDLDALVDKRFIEPHPDLHFCLARV